MKLTRDHAIAGAIVILTALSVFGSLETGRALLSLAATALTVYAALGLTATIGLSITVGGLFRATRHVLAVAVVVALVLWGAGRALIGVIS